MKVNIKVYAHKFLVTKYDKETKQLVKEEREIATKRYRVPKFTKEEDVVDYEYLGSELVEKEVEI